MISDQLQAPLVGAADARIACGASSRKRAAEVKRSARCASCPLLAVSRPLSSLPASGGSRDWAPESGYGPLQRLRQVLDPICGSHEASSFPASACFSAMRVRSTRDLMSSLRNTWRRWNATVCVLMNS